MGYPNSSGGLHLKNCIVILLVLTGCARSQIKTAQEAMRPAAMPSLVDDMQLGGVAEGLEVQIQQLKKSSATDLTFGPRTVPREAYIRALEYLMVEAKADPSGERFRAALKDKFDAFEVYGRDQWGEIFMTSYFEPVIEGSVKAGGKFTQPLYQRPKDMIDVDLDSFREARPSLNMLDQAPMEQRTLGNTLRGRLIVSPDPEKPSKVVAYPNRAGIYSGEVKKVAQPLVFVDPIDAFILEIQGSGVVKLKDGKELKVGYAAQNGHPYVAIGKHLFDIIPKEKMSMFAIENHLRSLPVEEARKVMELNPSYVFFRPLTTNGITFFGNGLVTGRTVATDQFYFPKGTLAFLEFEMPQFVDVNAVEASAWTPSSRFVFDQDTGGAIRGPGRLDLYSGRGPAAKQVAAVMKNKGRLYYFVPKAEF
jgi:membrane-bound lytic murein transglycosylase A